MQRRRLAILFGLAAALSAPSALAADHLDAPATTADPSSDITDVYTWVDGSSVVFVLDVTPKASVSSQFSNTVQYVLHTTSGTKFGESVKGVDIIATFDATQKIQLWVGTDDYVTGDASATAGLVSASGKTKVFAGLRDDPFFFNLSGFKDAVATVDSAAGALTFDAAGCPAVDAATSMALVGMLQGTMNGTQPAADFFAGLNVLSLVVSVDKSLVTAGGNVVSVWASTNKGQ